MTCPDLLFWGLIILLALSMGVGVLIADSRQLFKDYEHERSKNG